MPAIITHHLFGEDASRRLPDNLCFVEEELLAFLLGNQGADPFYFCFTATPAAIQACHTFARVMHDEREVDALMAARSAAECLPKDDRSVGRAFALGLVAHYLLDSEAHAFIHAQEEQLYAVDESLREQQAQIHALIESELDTWMLWSTRKLTIAEAPAHGNLVRTNHVSRIAGTICSQVAWQVFGITLNPDRYEGCLRDYELVYRTIDPTGNPYGRMITGAERLGTRHSLLDALSHSDKPTDDCPAANLECHPWTDPLTGEENTTSFPDVFYDSLEKWPALSDAFVRGDRAALESLVCRAYHGTSLEKD